MNPGVAASPRAPRVVENLNAALAAALADNDRLYLLGEDVADPYGGAFKVTRGLSTAFPGQVISTPISEGAIVGVAAGLALAGDSAIVEIMFGDFVTLAYDQIVNFAAKSVTMYGRRVPMRLVVRCPTGGGRGYGPTHSQSMQKHFLGVPNLSVYELSPYHDNVDVLRHLLATGEPAVFFEDKVLYGERMPRDGIVDDVFCYDVVDGVARVFVEDPEQRSDCVLIAPGGVAGRCVAAMRDLLLREEICCTLLVPSRLYPLDLAPMLATLAGTDRVVVVEESTSGGTWGAEVATRIHTACWGRLAAPVALAHSADSIIPTAAHLEQRVVVGVDTIRDTVRRTVHG